MEREVDKVLLLCFNNKEKLTIITPVASTTFSGKQKKTEYLSQPIVLANLLVIRVTFESVQIKKLIKY